MADATPPPLAGRFRDPVAGPRLLLLSAAVLLFIVPGASTLWTHEGRWAVICREMMRSGDYLHPQLFNEEYYDKPLLSYWLMIGCAQLLGGLSETALRLPGMLAGLLAVYCTYRIGLRRFGPAAGLAAGWLLTTCCVFVYWSRLACSDMLNLAAVAGATAWWTERRDRPGFVTWGVLGGIAAIGAQMKGLVAPALSFLVMLPDLLQEGRGRRHLHWTLAPASLIAAALYLIPFLLSGPESRGLEGVFRENVLRYFKPFDHEAPRYVYLQFLPLYALPWTPLLLAAAVRAARDWKQLGPESRWPWWCCLLILAFLTLGGSRRNYYVLPILPFAMLAVAEWLLAPARAAGWRRGAVWTGAASAAGMLIFFGALTPAVAPYGDSRILGREIRALTDAHAPWQEWDLVLFDTRPQMGYYLDPVGRPRRLLAPEELAQALRANPRTVVVTYARNAEKLAAQLPGWTVVREKSTLPWELGKPKKTPQAQVAFIPNKPADRIR